MSSPPHNVMPALLYQQNPGVDATIPRHEYFYYLSLLFMRYLQVKKNKKTPESLHCIFTTDC